MVLDVEVPINQIPASSLQLCIWSAALNEIIHDQTLEDGGFSPMRKHPSGIRNKTTIVPDKTKALKTTTNISEEMILICETYISLN